MGLKLIAMKKCWLLIVFFSMKAIENQPESLTNINAIL
jgi:hypothetical protein